MKRQSMNHCPQRRLLALALSAARVGIRYAFAQ